MMYRILLFLLILASCGSPDEVKDDLPLPENPADEVPKPLTQKTFRKTFKSDGATASRPSQEALREPSSLPKTVEAVSPPIETKVAALENKDEGLSLADFQAKLNALGVPSAASEVLIQAIRYAKLGGIEARKHLVSISGDFAKGEWGTKCFILAATFNQRESIDFLLDSGSLVDAKDESGTTPLMAASTRGHLTLVRYLLQKGANPNTPNKEGGTALSAASFAGHTPIVQELLSKGARTDVVERGNLTPLRLAEINGYKEIVVLLKKVPVK
jgi:Ankyrin repeats (3 copies)